MMKKTPTRGQTKAQLRVAKLAAAMVQRGYEYPLTEYRFHFKRLWRFDLAWPAYKVAVELHGGSFSGGRHTRGAGFASDCEKLAHAAAMGWLVVPLTHGQALDPVYQGLIAGAIEHRKSEVTQ